ncbi:cytochrome C oxidase subunit IV family protein [Cognatazoarcus halotolerans]|uniref:cytochrome C oxidase subunit IV family protein n=1 Tax=Cognatazoarcus halotolerans TaxID=2686016 RepID=UPI00135850AE|nr:cytochrome C oxidase subunit IV family protein [Cognatazoarcus halotolerans]
MTTRKLDITLAVLLTATLATWGIGEAGAAGVAAMVSMLVLTFVKGRLIALDYMGLRPVRLFWRGMLVGWLVLVLSLIALAYWIGLSA